METTYQQHRMMYITAVLRKTDSLADLSVCIEKAVLSELKEAYPDSFF